MAKEPPRGSLCLTLGQGNPQVAPVSNFQDSKTAMLLMVGTKSTIKGAAPFYGSMELIRVLGGFIVVPDTFVVLNICGNQHPAHAVLRAALLHPHLTVLKDNLGVDATQAFGAKRSSVIVVDIVSNRQGLGTLVD